MLLGALKEEGLYESTTVVFWGDHGYKLGEHCDWFKHDNYEDSTRILLIFKPASSFAMPRGRAIEELAENLDANVRYAARGALPSGYARGGQEFA